MLVLNAADVETLLPMDACIEVMKRALIALARKQAATPLRTVIGMTNGAIAAMPAYDGTTSTAGAKVITAFPGNPARGLPTHIGVVLVFEGETGTLQAMVDATAITAIRTAAVSSVATRLLAPRDPEVLTIIGTGAQADAHIPAMLLACPTIKRIRVVGRTQDKALDFIERHVGTYEQCRFVAIRSVEEAVQDAHVICTVTSSRTPVIEGSWLTPGVHINAVGSSVKSAREFDATAMALSHLYCDAKQSLLAESGDFLSAKDEGAVSDHHVVGELGQLLLREISGRAAPEEITMFKSLGLGVEDIAAAHYVHQRAVERGMGTEVPFDVSVHHA